MGCRRSFPKARLLRFVRAGGGLSPDPEARAAGRGAYLCDDPACARAAIERRGFARALRGPVTIPDQTIDFIREWQRSASTR